VVYILFLMPLGKGGLVRVQNLSEWENALKAVFFSWGVFLASETLKTRS
jgi:hypothetical protein